MTLNELMAQVQENLITVFDDYQGYEIDALMIDKMCQVVVDTFDGNFYEASMSGIEIVGKSNA